MNFMSLPVPPLSRLSVVQSRSEGGESFQRALGQDGELPRLTWQTFAPQSGEGFVHPSQLFDGLIEDGFFVHGASVN
jgi:hypothetical protein